MIRLAIRVRREDAEIAMAELLELVPGGVEEVDLGDRVEYAVYGAPGELPELPDLEAAAGDALVEIEPGTQPGAILTVSGQGMPRLRRPGRHGDLRVVVNVVVPRKLSKDQKRMAQELADSMTEENLRLDESLLGKLRRLLG